MMGLQVPLPKICIDCDKPFVGNGVQCERCLQDERAGQTTGITSNDKPATTGDLEQKTEPQEANK